MKIVKLLLLLIIATFVSCDAQNEENIPKILKLKKDYGLFYGFEEINLSELDKRAEITGDKSFEELKYSMSKEALDAKVIQFFNENFSSSEIEILYEASKNFSSSEVKNLYEASNNFDGSEQNNLNPEAETSKTLLDLGVKKDSLFRKLGEESFTMLQDFKQQLYVLDSINYNASKSKNLKTAKNEYVINAPNGIYETAKFNNQDVDGFMKSIEVVEKPGVTFNTIKNISIEPEAGPSLFYSINIVLNEEGTEQFRILTSKNIDKPMPIIIDNKIIIAPFVDRTIEGGKLQISGNIDYAEARFLVSKML